MKLTFIGATHEVTGSCTLLETCGKRILVDCGMEQGENTYENAPIPVALNTVDAVFLTHAHIDHSGKIPWIFANGCSAPIYSTEATERLCRIMLLDSAHIQMFEAEWRSRKAKRAGKEEYVPLYTADDVMTACKHFVSCSYAEKYDIFDGISIEFIDAGHLLGSASIKITINENGEEKVLLFSGDIGNVNRPLIKNPTFPDYADIVVIESTYGNRLHNESVDYIKQLSEVIQDTFDRGGNLVIPSFAVGRTQELLYIIRIIKEWGLIKNHADFPVYVDSPLAVEATEIYDDKILHDYFDEETLELISKGINPIKFPGLKVAVTSDESRMINDDSTPKVILSASGMCEAGRIRHHLKHNLWRADSTILFVGYQAEGTLGRKILEGAKTVKLFGEDIMVNAEIKRMEGISGHADMKILKSWLKSLKNTPEMVFVNHGHDTVCDEFAETVTETIGAKAIAPYTGAEYEIGKEVICINEGNKEKIQKHRKPEGSISVYERLVQCGKRLMTIIEKNKGLANKELAKFADQINALCEKWDR